MFHSVFFQDPPRQTRARIIKAALQRAGASSDAPLDWLRPEPEVVLGGPPDSVRFLVDLVTWRGAERPTLASSRCSVAPERRRARSR